MRKKEFRRQRIKAFAGGKESGQVDWVLGLFCIFFLAVLLSAQLQKDIFQASSLYMEDALAASNLASAVMEIEEFGISHTIRIDDPVQAYGRYCLALKENLNLNDDWECPNKALITGRVEIADYVIYNVEGEQVTSYRISPEGRVTTERGVRGSVAAPNGIMVDSTGIYSEIRFPVEGLFGIQAEAHRGKLVDIVINEEVTEHE